MCNVGCLFFVQCWGFIIVLCLRVYYCAMLVVTYCAQLRIKYCAVLRVNYCAKLGINIWAVLDVKFCAIPKLNYYATMGVHYCDMSWRLLLTLTFARGYHCLSLHLLGVNIVGPYAYWRLLLALTLSWVITDGTIWILYNSYTRPCVASI